MTINEERKETDRQPFFACFANFSHMIESETDNDEFALFKKQDKTIDLDED